MSRDDELARQRSDLADPRSSAASAMSSSEQVATHLAPVAAVGLPVAEVAGCQLVAELASGGHAVVYRAWHPLLRRHVAIKALMSDAQSDPALVQSFLREARLLAQLAHPNLPQVHDLIVAHGCWFLVMELCDGLDLLDVVSQQAQLPWATALAIFSQAARALAHVHARRFIHGDVKPANLILTRQGLVKLVDFGLARPLGQSDLPLPSTTPAYQSPEQAACWRQPDPRSDQFSLGLVLQQLLTGVQRSGLSEPTTLSMFPVAVQRLLARCLHPSREQRFSGMDDVVSACEAILGSDAPRREVEQVRGFVTLLQPPTVAAL